MDRDEIWLDSQQDSKVSKEAAKAAKKAFNVVNNVKAKFQKNDDRIRAKYDETKGV